MTNEERAVIEHLAHAWNAFLALDSRHADDDTEFRQGVHRLQEKVMARVARRADPDFFN